MSSIPAPYFIENKEWYYYDDELGMYRLTDKAPKEAVESYNESYKEEIEEGIIKKVIFDEKKYELNNKYIYVSVKYNDDDIPNRTYYYISDIEELKEGDYVLVDRNGLDTVGRAEKIEVFNKENAPFPVTKTKYISKIVPEDYETDEWDDDEETEILDTYKSMFLKTMFNRLSIKCLKRARYRIFLDLTLSFY